MGEKNKKQDYISVGELSVDFSENTLLPTDAFIGKQVELHYESGKEEKVTFIDIETLKWEPEDQGHRERFICSYNAIMPRSDIYFIPQLSEKYVAFQS